MPNFNDRRGLDSFESPPVKPTTADWPNELLGIEKATRAMCPVCDLLFPIVNDAMMCPAHGVYKIDGWKQTTVREAYKERENHD